MSDFLQTLPMWIPKAISVVFFFSVALVVWMLAPLERQTGSGAALWTDTRIWASFVLALQCLMYAIF